MYQEFAYDSAVYLQSKCLRNDVLRKPLGLELNKKDTCQDALDVHFGAFDDEGQLIACVILHRIDNHKAQLRQMAVSPQVQKQGIGQKLIAYFELRAKELGYQTIEMNARVLAQPFYEKQGYVAVGDVFDHLQIPHIKMQKTLYSASEQTGSIT